MNKIPTESTVMYRVEITDKQYEWLKKTIFKLDEKLQTQPTHYELEHIELIHDLCNRLDLAEKYFDTTETPKYKTKIAESKARIAALRPTRPATVPGHGACDTHPLYQGKRRPRTDCQICWDTFKFYNPASYEVARRDFERKQNSAQ